MSDERTVRRGYRGFRVVGLLALISLAGLMGWLVWPTSLSGPPVPDPNGYDTFLAAGKLVEGVPPAQGVANQATDEELRAFVASNTTALVAAQPGFAQGSVVPLGGMRSIEAHIQRLGPLRQLGRVLACRAVLARREGRTSDALQASLDLLRLAHAASHGGLFIDRSVGAALRWQAIDELEVLVGAKLADEDARRAIAELQRLGRDAESLQKVADRDLEFALSRQGLPMRVGYLINRKAMNALRAPALKAVEAADQGLQARAGRLLVKLALQAYAADHPKKPQPPTLGELVPAYLMAVPLAPGTNRRVTPDDLKPEPETIPSGRGRG